MSNAAERRQLKHRLRPGSPLRKAVLALAVVLGVAFIVSAYLTGLGIWVLVAAAATKLSWNRLPAIVTTGLAIVVFVGSTIAIWRAGRVVGPYLRVPKRKKGTRRRR